MKLCTFLRAGAPRVGVVFDDAVVDLSIAAPSLPRDLLALLAAGPAELARAKGAAAMRIEIEGLGAIENRVVAEPESTARIE
jgi:hypothetical protein